MSILKPKQRQVALVLVLRSVSITNITFIFASREDGNKPLFASKVPQVPHYGAYSEMLLCEIKHLKSLLFLFISGRTGKAPKLSYKNEPEDVYLENTDTQWICCHKEWLVISYPRNNLIILGCLQACFDEYNAEAEPLWRRQCNNHRGALYQIADEHDLESLGSICLSPLSLAHRWILIE